MRKEGKVNYIIGAYIMNMLFSIAIMIVVAYLIVPVFILVTWSAVALFAMVFIILAASGMKYIILKSYNLLLG